MTSFEFGTLWQALTPAEKQQGCLSLWTAQESGVEDARMPLLAELSRALNFRPTFLARQKPEALAKYLSPRIERAAFRPYQKDVLRAWLLEHRRDLLITFLDAMDIPHEQGLIGDVPPPDEAAFRKGLRLLKEKFPARDVLVYLGFILLAMDGPWVAALPPAMTAEDLDVGKGLAPVKA